MKKRFTVKLMFGDGDSYKTKKVVLDDPDKITFFTRFLEIYKERFEPWNYICQWNEEEKRKYIPEIEELRYLFDSNGDRFDEDTDLDVISDWVTSMLLSETIDYEYMKIFMGDYTAKVLYYTIEDLGDDSKAISRKEAEKIIKEKLGMKVHITN